jgi:NCAIR mutase (PurE)-related protein
VTILSLALFSARSKLFPGRDNTIFDLRATDDKFVIVVETGLSDIPTAEKAGKIMEEQGAIEIVEKEFGSVNA